MFRLALSRGAQAAVRFGSRSGPKAPATAAVMPLLSRSTGAPARTLVGATRPASSRLGDYFAHMIARRDPRALCRLVEDGAVPANKEYGDLYMDALRHLGRERMARDLYTRFITARGGPAFPGYSHAHAQHYGRYGGSAYDDADPSLDGRGRFFASSEQAGHGSGERAPLEVKIVGSGSKGGPGSTVMRWVFFFGVGWLVFWSYDKVTGAIKNGGPGPASLLSQMSATPKPEMPTDVGFDDVVGVDEAKESLADIVAYLRDPEHFSRLGGKIPKGVLMTGPPGTGKTLLARAVAGEVGCAFFQTNGSSFEEMFVGVGAKRVRALFEAAAQHAPAIIFIDEIDAVGGRRREVDSGSARMSLNQLLSEMDGFQQDRGIVVIAATNLPDMLDPALMRPGRFDMRVDIPKPDIEGRRKLLDLYLGKVVTRGAIDVDTLARGTVGMTGADISNMINVAAVRAAKLGLAGVNMDTIEHSKDVVLMGPERRSAVLTRDAVRTTAYHEGGHALVALCTEGSNPVYKATVVPRGRALGLVMQLPSKDETSIDRQQLMARMDVCMGGRAAEEVVFGGDHVTSGASSDFQQATNIAREMVLRWGMSDLGVEYIDEQRYASLGGEAKEKIDAEVRRLLAESHARAAKLIRDKREKLDLLADALIEYETLSGEEVSQIVEGREFVRTLKPSRDRSPSDQGSAPSAETATGGVVVSAKENVGGAGGADEEGAN